MTAACGVIVVFWLIEEMAPYCRLISHEESQIPFSRINVNPHRMFLPAYHNEILIF